MNTEGQNATDLIETEVTVSETLETVEVPVVAEPPWRRPPPRRWR